jgi:uroporphyrinogen decarboxylase
MKKQKPQISHKERIQALLSGQATDRHPIALWRHFPVDDQDPYTLSKATLNFQKNFDFDLVKVTPASSFCLKDWGAEDRWEGNIEGTRRYTEHVIHNPADWENKIKYLDPTSNFLSKQLVCLRLLRDEIQSSTPIIHTIFSPLSQAKNLAGNDLLLSHLRLFPEAVMKGLETISKTTIAFMEAANIIGVDGFFFAVQHAQASLLTKEEYKSFGTFFDLDLLKIAQSSWLNILHLHGNNVYFDVVSNFPVQVINWHDRDTAPSLKNASGIFDGILCGGLKRETLSLGTPDEIENELKDAIAQVKGKRLLLGTGCVLPSITPYGNILTARQMVDRYES